MSSEKWSYERLRVAFDSVSRVSLGHFPTPLDRCPHISEDLGVKLTVKRDDCSGLAFGGNKVRQHEFVLAAAVQGGFDCVIQGAASQSNHSRQLAAAGAKLGLDVFLTPKADSYSSPPQGNYLLDHVLGASISPISPESSSIDAKASLAAELRARGRRPYISGMGDYRSQMLAALSYVGAVLELVDDLGSLDEIDWIFTTSQGSTMVGLQLACHILGARAKVVGVSPCGPEHESFASELEIRELMSGVANELGWSGSVESVPLTRDLDFVGDGYGIVSEEGRRALALLASREGILLDPVYTSKGFAALIDYCKRGTVSQGSSVVFVHTGGLPALFTYAGQVLPEATKRTNS